MNAGCGAVQPMTNAFLGIDTRITVFAAGLIFLLAVCLGIWKYRQMATNENHLAHPYVDIAHRSALLYSFAAILVAVFVGLSAWPTWLNLTAAMVVVFSSSSRSPPTSRTASGATPPASSNTPMPACVQG
jgi:hypothetical protein